MDAELSPLTDDAWRTPGRIGAPHILDELSDFFDDRGLPWLAALAEPSPVIPKPFLWPGNDGTGLDKLQALSSAGPKP